MIFYVGTEVFPKIDSKSLTFSNACEKVFEICQVEITREPWRHPGTIPDWSTKNNAFYAEKAKKKIKTDNLGSFMSVNQKWSQFDVI